MRAQAARSKREAGGRARGYLPKWIAAAGNRGDPGSQARGTETSVAGVSWRGTGTGQHGSIEGGGAPLPRDSAGASTSNAAGADQKASARARRREP